MAIKKHYSITKLSQGLVAPASQTPVGKLPLSGIDISPGLRCHVRSLHVFSAAAGKTSPAKTIKKALAEALVQYYPLAGRLVGGSEVQVDCTGEGVWFVEAAANCSLEQVNYLEVPFVVSTDELVPDSRPEKDLDDFLLLVQVTEFTCGGFMVGIQLSHAIADGLGAGQFFTAVGELARGHSSNSVTPIWSRDVIPSPPGSTDHLAGPPPRQVPMAYFTADVSLSYINKLKSDYFTDTAKRCSTFDVTMATLWRCRAPAIKFSPSEMIHLVFMANLRHLLGEELPEQGKGYYGNCFGPVTVSAAAETITNASVLEIVKLIRKAKAAVPSEFAKWGSPATVESSSPFDLRLDYDTLFASDWTQLGFLDKVDYGWGPAARIVPFSHAPDVMPMVVLGLPTPVKGGSGRIMAHCVKAEHLAAFQQEMKEMVL